jgi:Rhodopirellula transposase DDE domain
MIAVGSRQRLRLNAKCGIDPYLYPAGVKVSDAEMAAINIRPHEFHGEWNYSISPQTTLMER